MTTKTNSIQAVLDKKAQSEDTAVKLSVKAAKKQSPSTAIRKPSRAATKLIGGHFPHEVSRQLGIIAAEEGQTKQELLTEALNMLFLKKGKAKIADL